MDVVNRSSDTGWRRLELVVPELFLDRALEVLQAAGLGGYTALQVAQSKGARSGEVLYDGVLPGSNNVWLFTLGQAARVELAFDRLRPLIDQWGGLLLVSDVRAIHAMGLP